MKLYKIDMHVHTAEVSPCGKVKAAEVVRLYKDAGYDAIVITDHYSSSFFQAAKDISWAEKIDRFLEGYRIAFAEGESVGLNVILGMELRFESGANEYLVYGVDEKFLKENEELYKLEIDKFSTMVKDKGFLIYQAHPFRPKMTLADKKYLYGIEVFNGNPRHNSQNDVAYKYAVEHNFKMISGSDFHQVEDLAKGGIAVKNKVTNIKELMDVLTSNDYELLSAQE